jgi:segregation and condensation protein B
LALLFASQEFLSAKTLREAMGEEWDTPRLRQLVKAVNKQLLTQEQPFEVVETDATFRLRTRTEYFPWVRRLFKGQAPRKLSQAGLETLAIIAYKQPITKAEIEAIRGVNIDGALKSLLEKRFIDISRRTDAVGGAFTYCTTREFMRYFGLSRLPEDLPRLSEFEQIVNAKALIPQIAADGSVVESEQAEPDAEQMEFHGEIHP